MSSRTWKERATAAALESDHDGVSGSGLRFTVTLPDGDDVGVGRRNVAVALVSSVPPDSPLLHRSTGAARMRNTGGPRCFLDGGLHLMSTTSRRTPCVTSSPTPQSE